MVRLLERLKAQYPDNVEEVERFAPAVLQVVPETMEEFLAGLRSEYGSYDGLAESSCGGGGRRPAPRRPHRRLRSAPPGPATAGR